GLWGRVVTEGKPVITNNPRTHPDSLGVPEGHPGLTAFLGVPLKLEDRAVGLIGLGNKEQGYNETDLRNIEELSLAFCEALRLKQTEAALKDSEARFRAIADLAHDAIIMADQNGNIIYWNQAAGKIFGYKAGEVMEKNLHELLAPERFKEEYREGLEAFSKSGNGKAVGQTLELEGVRKDGSEFPLELSMSGVLIQGSWHAIGIVRDITERKRMEKELERLSYQDGLTGVANRRLFEQTLDREWQRLARSKSPLALILLDIDYFKAFNDRYGHQKGDECLRQVARCIDGLLKRPADLVARYGGEEFALILPETGANGARAVAEKIRSEIQALGIAHASSPVAEQLTVSLGVAWFVPTTSSAPEDLVAAADEALYQAKSDGRNRVRWKEVTWQ
ncbi:MAG: diguanylate cyclase, partial [Desulfobacterales bacterium]|nr:diguanylate cyclase [Desulfobacterales bacterium]